MKQKALFIRLDKMGDLVLTLPCDHLVTSTYECHWMTPKGLDFVVNSATDKKNYYPQSNQWNWKNFFQLYRLVRKINPQVSVSFHVPWWVNMALWLACVPTRGGVLSQWHSYLFLNKGLRQKRSRVEAHEMEYNYQLVEYTFDLPTQPEQWTHLHLQARPETPLQFDIEQDYFVVHPGMGGSALNWPTESYAKLINEISQKAPVVITGTKSDEIYLSPLKLSLKNNHQVVWLDKQLDGYQLLKLLKNATANIAPSTGVLHLSASLGAASLGIFSPIKVHTAARWGPKGPETSTFSPEKVCDAYLKQSKEVCPHDDCMAQMDIMPVVKKALSYL